MKGFFNKFGLDALHDLAEFLQSAWHVALILLLAWLVMRLAHRLIRAFRIYMSTRADIEIGVREREVMQGSFMATCFFGLRYSNGSGAQQPGGVPGPGESAYRCGGSGEEAPWDLPGC